MWILRADLTWYMSTNRSFHLSAPVELSLKSPRVGNPVSGGTAAVASALVYPFCAYALANSRWRWFERVLMLCQNWRIGGR